MLTGFQFRASKGILDLSAKNIAESIGMHPGSLVRFNLSENLEYLNCGSKNNMRLKRLFESYNLVFLDEKSISYKLSLNEKDIPVTSYLTRFQLKAARIATGLTQEELGHHIKISSSIISNFECLENSEYIKSRVIDISLLKKFFEHLGIKFPNDLTIVLTKDPKNFVRQLKY